MSKKKSPKVELIQEKEKEIPVQILAKSIVDVAEAMERIKSSRVTRDLIVTLVWARSGVSKAAINTILDNLENIERQWLKKAAE